MNIGQQTPSFAGGTIPGGGMWGGRRKLAWSIVLGVVLAILTAVVIAYALVGQRPGSPIASLLGPSVPPTQVAPEKEYKNPFDRETQYVNPFEEFKSPFHSLQQ